ncbi:MAG: ATP-binding protein [Cyanobacteria bacterium P01_A01_bin.84]
MVRNSANEPEMYCLDIDTRDFYKELHLRKRVEQALLNSEEKFRRLFEMTADAVMLLDKDGFLDCNTAALDIFGCQSKKEFCGKHPSDFSPLKQPNGEYSDKLEAQNIQIALSKGIYRFEWQHRRSDASEFSAEVLLSRIEINGKEILQAFVRDITERKAAEAAIKQKSQQLEQALQELQQTQLQLVQSEKMSALGNLVAGVAHEINNPVGFIAGNITEAMTAVKDITEYLKLYQETFPNPGNKIAQKAEEFEIGYLLEDLPKMLNSMEVGCDRIINISTSLRVFSRADKDYKVLFNIHTGIDSTILILKHRLKYNEQRPEINIIIEYGEIPEIKCFPGEINQVFMNIIANAIDALDESNKGLSFAEIVANPNQIIIKTSLEGQYVKISIADNGKGMSKEIQEKVFDRLFTTKEIGKGTGLGLAIAHHIVVNKHGGSLQVNSELDKGTEFAIALPIDDINENCKIS